MCIIDKYTTRQVTGSYLLVLFLFIGLFLIVDLFTNLYDIIKEKVELIYLLKYYFYMLPLSYKMVSPYALLISVLYIFGELNKNNEIISVRVAGVSALRIVFPVVVFALVVSVFSLFVQESLLLDFQKKALDIKNNMIKKIVPNKKQSDISFSSENMIFFAQSFIPAEEKLIGVTIFFEDNSGNVTKKLVCETLKYQNKKWLATKVLEYELSIDGRILDKPVYTEVLEIPLKETPKQIGFKKSYIDQLSSLKSLKKEILKLKKINAFDKLTKITIDYHHKLVEPFSHFFLIIGILPFAVKIRKRHIGLSALGVGFIFGFLYYCLLQISLVLGKTGWLLPLFSVWTVPIFFTTVGIVGLLLLR